MMKTILVDAWNTLILEEGLDQEMCTLLETFPHNKIILTNANPEEQAKMGMSHLPYPLFTLAHEPNKTDPAYFQTFLREKGLSAEDVIYFEHNPEAVTAAASLGIISYWFDKDLRDLAALEDFLTSHLS